MTDRTIYRNWNSGFGDTWATISLLAQKQGDQQDVYLSTIQHGESLRAMQQQILDALDQDHFDNYVVLVDQEPTISLDGYAVWGALPLPTRIQWTRPGIDRTIIVQFDGVSSQELKNPPPQDVVKICQWAERNNFRIVKAGKQLGLEKSILAMSRAAMFVGIDSGMSHVAASVGIPSFILEYQLPVVTCHRHRSYVLARGADHFIAQAENYLTFLRFIRA